MLSFFRCSWFFLLPLMLQNSHAMISGEDLGNVIKEKIPNGKAQGHTKDGVDCRMSWTMEGTTPNQVMTFFIHIKNTEQKFTIEEEERFMDLAPWHVILPEPDSSYPDQYDPKKHIYYSFITKVTDDPALSWITYEGSKKVSVRIETDTTRENPKLQYPFCTF